MKIVLGIVYLVFLMSNAEVEKLNDCRSTNQSNASIITRKKISDRYRMWLFKIQHPITWCQAYHVCRKQPGDLYLANINTADMQEVLSQGLNKENVNNLNKENVNNLWLGGRRKDFGSDWTWLDNSLQDYTETETAGNNTGNCASCASLQINTNNKIVFDMKSTKALCTDDKQILRATDWWAAQNDCSKLGLRLVTTSDVTVTDAGDYYIGLYKNPWIWVKTEGKDYPVIYSNWTNMTISRSGNCMTLNARTMTWEVEECEQKHQHILCSAPGISTNGSTFPREAIIFLAVLPVALIIILLAVHMVRRIKAQRLLRDWRRSRVQLSQEHHGLAHAQPPSLQMEIDAYRPISATPRMVDARTRGASTLPCTKPIKPKSLDRKETCSMHVKTCTDSVYSTVNKRSTRSRQNEMPASDVMTDSDEDVMIDNELYGDAEMPYSVVAIAEIEKKPYPSPKPPAEVINKHLTNKKHGVASGGGKSRALEVKDDISVMLSAQYSRVQKVPKSKAHTMRH